MRSSAGPVGRTKGGVFTRYQPVGLPLEPIWLWEVRTIRTLGAMMTVLCLVWNVLVVCVFTDRMPSVAYVSGVMELRMKTGQDPVTLSGRALNLGISSFVKLVSALLMFDWLHFR